MAWFFALSLPGLIVLLIIGGTIQLIFFRHHRGDRPGTAAIGFELFDTVLRPGKEHLVNKRESKRHFRKEEEGAPPSLEIDLFGKSARILRRPDSESNAGKHKEDEQSKRRRE